MKKILKKMGFLLAISIGFVSAAGAAPVIATPSDPIGIKCGTKVELPVAIYDDAGGTVTTTLGGESSLFSVEDGMVYYIGGAFTGDNVTYNLTITASDGTTESAKALQVTVLANHAPTIESADSITTYQNHILPILIEDEDGDPVTITATTSSLTFGDQFTCNVQDDGVLVITATSWAFMATSMKGSVTVTAKDDRGASTTKTVNITLNKSGSASAVTLTISPSKEIVYGSPLSDSIASWTASADGTYRLSEGAKTVTAADILSAGTHAITFLFVPSDAAYASVVTTNSVTVVPRPVTLTSGSSTKYYDGEPLTNRTVTLAAGSSFVGGEGFYYTDFPSVTAGSVTNTFTVNGLPGTDTNNYAVTKDCGTLKVIIIRAAFGGVYYDSVAAALAAAGEEHAEEVQVLDLEASLPDGYTLRKVTDGGETKWYLKKQADNDSLDLGQIDFTTMTFPNATATSYGLYRQLTVLLTRRMTSDTIQVTEDPDFTHDEELSTDYSYVINITAPGKSASEIAEFIRRIVFSGCHDQVVRVTLTAEPTPYRTIFYDATKHYYQYVPVAPVTNDWVYAGITWKAAYEAARGMSFAGRQGYLATLLTHEEDMFAYEASDGRVGWLGGTCATHGEQVGQFYNDIDEMTDDTHVGHWYWACGPEIGETFYDCVGGNSDDDYERNLKTNGYYHNWDADEREPSHTDQRYYGGYEGFLTTLGFGYGYSTGTELPDKYGWNDVINDYKTRIDYAKWTPLGYVVEFGNLSVGDTSDTQTTLPRVVRDSYFIQAVTFTPTEVDNTTNRVYVGGKELPGAVSYLVPSNATDVVVVYEAGEGSLFADGTSVKTNQVDCTSNPAATVVPDAPFVPVARNVQTRVLYAMVQAAFDAAISGQTIEMLTNVSENVWITTDKTNTLDLAGYVLKSDDSNDPVMVINSTYAAITICDTSADHTGAITTGGVTCPGNGAGINLAAGSLSLYDVTITNCVSGGNGGAIYQAEKADLLMSGCTVKNNTAATAGGGIYKKGGCTGVGSTETYYGISAILQTEVVGNTAGTCGGGVYFQKMSEKSSCLVAGTLVAMADGTSKAIEDVAEGDAIKTFDHEGGTNSSARVFIWLKESVNTRAFTLAFEGGYSVNCVLTHDFLMKDGENSCKYVCLGSANAADYIGKLFYGVDGAWHELKSVTNGEEVSEIYELYTAQHLNSYANGLLTVPSDVEMNLNLYKLGADLKADADQLAADVAKYGYYSYEEAAAKGVSRAYYDDSGMKYVNVIVGKGLATWEELERTFASAGRGGILASPEGTDEASSVVRQDAAPTMAQGVAPAMVINGEATIDDFAAGVLTLGSGAVITNNTANGAKSNIHLVTAISGTDSLVQLTASHDGINAGVSCSWGTGPFTTNYNVTASDVALFTSDNPMYFVKFVSDHLELATIVAFTPTAVDNTTTAVYVGDVPVEKTGDVYQIASNATDAVVVYTAVGDRYFDDGSAVMTNAIDAATNPATAEMPAAPAKPSVKVGTLAQRYPWNGTIDVPYRVKNWPAGGAGRKVKFTVKVGETVMDCGTTVPEGSGKVTGTFAIDLKALGLPTDRGEATVRAEVVE